MSFCMSFCINCILLRLFLFNLQSNKILCLLNRMLILIELFHFFSNVNALSLTIIDLIFFFLCYILFLCVNLLFLIYMGKGLIDE